jgi:hypothetical protein
LVKEQTDIIVYGLTVALFWGMGWGLLTHGQTILPESSEKNIKRALSSTVDFLGLRPLGNSLVFFSSSKMIALCSGKLNHTFAGRSVLPGQRRIVLT